MRTEIPNIKLLKNKNVPGHGKVAGFTGNKNVVVIIPSDDTKFSLVIEKPKEILKRKVTEDGKILGLTRYIGTEIFIIDTKED